MSTHSIDGYLDLLDRQLLDHEGRMVGKVDNVELEERDDGRVYVTALLSGPGALGPRYGGALATVVTATWSRLSGRTEPTRVPWGQVAQLGTAVHLAVGSTAAGLEGFERWMRDRVIAAIPGSGVDPE